VSHRGPEDLPHHKGALRVHRQRAPPPVPCASRTHIRRWRPLTHAPNSTGQKMPLVRPRRAPSDHSTPAPAPGGEMATIHTRAELGWSGETRRPNAKRRYPPLTPTPNSSGQKMPSGHPRRAPSDHSTPAPAPGGEMATIHTRAELGWSGEARRPNAKRRYRPLTPTPNSSGQKMPSIHPRRAASDHSTPRAS
jgi:hypothetical protein